MNTQTSKPPIIQYMLVAVLAFGLSFLATFLVNNWTTINVLFYESSLAKYEVMTGQRGPSTYLIFHDDFAALQSMADTHDGILGVEQHEGSNVAKMAFLSAKSPLINEVRELDVVTNMFARNVAMLCH